MIQRLLSSLVIVLLFTVVAWSSPPAIDDEACITGAGKVGGWWGLSNCTPTTCDTDSGTHCEMDSRQEGSDWVVFCSCPGYGGEPECCRIVLRQTGGSGPFLPERMGACKAQNSDCPAGDTCVMTGTSTRKSAACVTGTPPQQ